MNKSEQLVVNMIAQIIGFSVNIGISFFLTPFIVKNIGSEAYGFVSLANNFVSYAQLITIALNSMVGRFITIKIHQNDFESANRYFTSVVITNVIVAIILTIPSVFLILFLNNFVNVSGEILGDIQLLWSFIFLNFIISLLAATYGVSTFAKNKIYLSSIRGIIANIIKVSVLLVSFSILSPSVWYVGLASVICTVYILAYNIYYKKKLIPEIKLKRTYFDIYSIKELIASGIWNTITRLGQLLLNGLDLLIANILIDPLAMGTLAIAKTVPTAISSFMGSFVSVFSPSLTIEYAKNDKKALLNSLKKSIKIMSIVVNIPIIVLIILGDSFYSLWVPSEDPGLLQILSVITIGGLVFSGGINCIYQIFTVTNNLKLNSMVLVLSGILNTVVVFILVATTDLGLFAIAGISTILGIIRNLIFTAPYGAKCLELKWYSFFPDIIKPFVSVVVLSILGIYFVSLFTIDTWAKLINASLLIGIIAFVVNIYVILNRCDRKELVKFVLAKLKRR